MAIDININSTGLQELNNTLREAISKLSANISTAQTGKAPIGIQGASNTNNVESALNALNTSINNNTTQIKNGARNTGGTPGNIKVDVPEIKDLGKSINNLRDQLEKNSNNPQQGPGGKPKEDNDPNKNNIFKQFPLLNGMVLGTAALASYIAQGYGTTAGFQESAGMNRSLKDYSSFEKESREKEIQNKNALEGATFAGVTSISLATLASGLLPLGGAIIAALGALGSIGANYFIGKNTEEDKQKAANQSLADTMAFKLSSVGLSNRIEGNDPNNPTSYSNLYRLASIMHSPNANNLAETLTGARRDYAGSLSSVGKVEFNDGISRLGIILGESNLSKLAFAITQFSKVAGMNSNSVEKLVARNNAAYGGDQLEIISKAIAIAQSTNIGGREAFNLAERYQYNEAEMANKISRAGTSPLSAFTGSILAKIGGLTHDEFASGTLNGRDRALLRRINSDPNYKLDAQGVFLEMRMNALRARGSQNLFASEMGSIGPSKKTLKDMDTSNTEMMNKANADIVKALQENLSNMKVNTQTVTAGSVIIQTSNPVQAAYNAMGGAVAQMQGLNIGSWGQ